VATKGNLFKILENWKKFISVYGKNGGLKKKETIKRCYFRDERGNWYGSALCAVFNLSRLKCCRAMIGPKPVYEDLVEFGYRCALPRDDLGLYPKLIIWKILVVYLTSACGLIPLWNIIFHRLMVFKLKSDLSF